MRGGNLSIRKRSLTVQVVDSRQSKRCGSRRKAERAESSNSSREKKDILLIFRAGDWGNKGDTIADGGAASKRLLLRAGGREGRSMPTGSWN